MIHLRRENPLLSHSCWAESGYGGAPIHLDESYTMVDHPLFDGSHYTLNELLFCINQLFQIACSGGVPVWSTIVSSPPLDNFSPPNGTTTVAGLAPWSTLPL